jgi:hypothetical protein
MKKIYLDGKSGSTTARCLVYILGGMMFQGLIQTIRTMPMRYQANKIGI